MQYNELDAELHVISDDEAASLLWAAQWLDEHREYAVTAVRLDDTADPDDEEDVTTTLVLTLTEPTNTSRANSIFGRTAYRP